MLGWAIQARTNMHMYWIVLNCIDLFRELACVLAGRACAFACWFGWWLLLITSQTLSLAILRIRFTYTSSAWCLQWVPGVLNSAQYFFPLSMTPAETSFSSTWSFIAGHFAFIYPAILRYHSPRYFRKHPESGYPNKLVSKSLGTGLFLTPWKIAQLLAYMQRLTNPGASMPFGCTTGTMAIPLSVAWVEGHGPDRPVFALKVP